MALQPLQVAANSLYLRDGKLALGEFMLLRGDVFRDSIGEPFLPLRLAIICKCKIDVE